MIWALILSHLTALGIGVLLGCIAIRGLMSYRQRIFAESQRKDRVLLLKSAPTNELLEVLSERSDFDTYNQR